MSKKHEFTFIISMSILFSFVVTTSMRADNRDALELKITLEKDEFLLDELLYLEMAETNISDQEVAVTPMRADWSWGNFKIVLKDENGTELDYKGGEAYGKAGNWPGFIIAPGERYVTVKDLLSVYGEWGDPAHRLSLYLPAGTYTVQAIHHSNMKAYAGPNRQRDDKQTVYSNIVEFKVVQPQGLERQAYQRLMEIMAEYNTNIPKKREMRSVFREFISSYPNSAYLPQAYIFLLTIYNRNAIAGKDVVLQEAITRLPDSRFSYEVINSFMSDKMLDFINKSGYDKDALLQKLNINDTENRSASYYARCYIDNIKIGRRWIERLKGPQR